MADENVCPTDAVWCAMRLGIRAKLVGTLLLAGLLPLALALGVVLFGAVELRLSSKGQAFRALARQQASRLSTIVGSQIELARLVNDLPGTAAVLRAANEGPKPTPEQIEEIEARWPRLGPGDSPLREVLGNHLAEHWQSVQAAERRFTEVLITDWWGKLVAATNKTTDYYQADEAWWSACYDQGRGRAVIWDVAFDESAIAPDGRVGALVADLCLPIYEHSAGATTRATTRAATAGSGRRVVGVCKISLDATWILGNLDHEPRTEDFSVTAWLVRGDGKSVPGAPQAPPVGALPAGLASKLSQSADGWTIDDRLDGHEVLGFAEVEQSRRLIDDPGQRWYVVVAASRRDVLSSVYRMAWLILVLGLAVIGACFLSGWVIAQREIVRPLTALERAVEELKAGNRGHRLSETRGPNETFREDELGRLAHGFNTMADELQGNMQRLEQADELKRQFIDLASHELRTPVTYIMGAAQLAQRQGDGREKGASEKGGPETIGVMGRIGSKAQRLNRIVENMFKLLAGDQFDRGLRLGRVDVAEAIGAAVAEHEPFLRERRQTFDVRIDNGLPPISADPDKVRDILGNLISNAIRFSPDGGVVGVHARAVDGVVEITVSDSGPGIPEADLPNLFQPFFTGGGTVGRHTSGDYQYMSRGIGLGLSVVKRFVEIHGGTVDVETGAGGTRARVRLPIQSSPES
jgi:signal transduction histidine kinase